MNKKSKLLLDQVEDKLTNAYLNGLVSQKEYAKVLKKLLHDIEDAVEAIEQNRRAAIDDAMKGDAK